MPLRLVFMGTPDFAVPTLRALRERGHDIAAVYCRQAKPAGRGMKLQATPVEREAVKHGLSVLTPKSLRNAEAEAAFRAHNADAAVVVAYGLILPQPILDAVPSGCFNLHASLLPRWRGAAPLNRAIMSGDRETGAMTMKMDAGLDTGDIALTDRVAITDAMTVSDLHDLLSMRGATLMADTIDALEKGSLALTPQPTEGVTYAGKISKEEARIDWTKPSHDVLRHIHGLSPFPGAWCELPLEGALARVKVLRCEMADGRGAPGQVLDDSLTIACGDGAIRFVQLQRAGKQAMSAPDFLRGTPLRAGQQAG